MPKLLTGTVCRTKEELLAKVTALPMSCERFTEIIYLGTNGCDHELGNRVSIRGDHALLVYSYAEYSTMYSIIDKCIFFASQTVQIQSAFKLCT